jgi:hypothetical protein
VLTLRVPIADASINGSSFADGVPRTALLYGGLHGQDLDSKMREELGEFSYMNVEFCGGGCERILRVWGLGFGFEEQ